MKSVLLKFFILSLILLLPYQPAHSKLYSVEEMQDVDSTDWAYQSLQRLVAKYGIQGYPDETFRGDQPAKRYEMAAALEQVASVIGDEIVKLGVEKADKQDIQAVINLQNEFRIELAAFKLRAEAIERKNIEQDAQLSDQNQRIAKIERIQKTRDMLLMNQSNLGKNQEDSLGAIFRVRDDTQFVYNYDEPKGFWGEGSAFFRVTAAVGNGTPLNSAIPTGTVLDFFNVPATDAATSNDTTRSLGYFTNTRPVAFIEQAYISQDVHPAFLRGKFNVTGGLITIVNYFDANDVANDEATQFSNMAFVNNMAMTHNYINPGLIFSYDLPLIEEKLNLKFTAGIVSHDVYKLDGAFSAMYEGAVNYTIKDKTGNIRVGGYNGSINSSDRQFLPYINGDFVNHGFYLSVDQQLFRNMKVFGRYNINDNAPVTEALTLSKQSFSFGAEIPVKDILKIKRNDVIGIAYGQTKPLSNIYNNPAGYKAIDEKVFEAYYNFVINDNISFGPDIQLMFAPGGFEQPLITVLGFRTYVSF